MLFSTFFWLLQALYLFLKVLGSLYFIYKGKKIIFSSNISDKTSVHLMVHAASIINWDLESSLITPGIVPGVHTEPVVKTRCLISAPANNLNCMTTKLITSSVNVHTASISFEIFIYSESTGNGTISINFSLNIFFAKNAVRWRPEMLVVRVHNIGVSGAGVIASRLNLHDIITWAERRGSYVMSALCHSVVIAEITISVVTTSDNTLWCKPLPGSADLATIATVRLALQKIAASSGVWNRQ